MDTFFFGVEVKVLGVSGRISPKTALILDITSLSDCLLPCDCRLILTLYLGLIRNNGIPSDFGVSEYPSICMFAEVVRSYSD